MTVGLVVVSHSRALADAAVELAMQMAAGSDVRLAVAAGLDDGTLGTDATAVVTAVEEVDSPAGVLVLLDLGSAVLSADLALEMLDDEVRSRVRLSAAPLVEGLVSAVVTAAGGGSLDEVAAEAASALDGKRSQVGDEPVAESAVPVAGARSTVVEVRIPNGLHARPAARLVAAVRAFDADVTITDETTGAGPVSARSLTRITALGVRQGHRVEVSAAGPDAARALAAVSALAGRDFDDRPDPVPVPAPAAGPVGAAPGIGIGPVFRFEPARPTIPAETPDDPQAGARLARAIEATREQIAGARARAVAVAGEDAAQIFDAHAAVLDDPELLAAARRRIGSGPAAAWDAAITDAVEALGAVADDYQRARAADIRSVGDDVLRAIVGAPAADRAASGVVVADDLTPAQVAALDPSAVLAVVLASGSATSHAAILARAAGIPMVTGAGRSVLEVPAGTVVAVDGGSGEVAIDGDLERFERRRDAYRRAAAAAGARAAEPAVTADGITIAVAANVGSAADARAAAAAHADGSGLVRTEFAFLDREQAPPVDEQEEIYRSIAAPLSGHRVVFRTLDAGGDKPLPFMPVPHEENPFLGVRGLRLSLRNKALLTDQLRALLRVAADHAIGVMFPMVSTVAELDEALTLLDGLCPTGRPELLSVGIMVEVPSAALKTATFVDRVDFLSIGTNDLTQYSLAAERGNPSLAGLSDALDPGVLRLIGEVCGQAAGRASVSVCGELAADPLATALLLGLGVGTLSVAVPAVAGVKEAVRGVDLAAAREWARDALTLADADAVRASVRSRSGDPRPATPPSRQASP